MLRSTDGGNSFQATASPATGIGNIELSTFPPGKFRVVTIPTACVFGSTILVSWADNREGKSRIYYAASTNGGGSWATPPSGQRLLVDAAIDPNVFHFHPAMVFRSDGIPACAFYEFGPKPLTLMIDMRVAYSFDKGGSFPELNTVTERPWDPALDAPVDGSDPSRTFIGDYFGLDASENGFYPLWTDTRTGIQELWMDSVGPPVVPYVIGSPMALAQQDVLNAGLVPKFTGGGGSGTPWVESQTPFGGTAVPSGSTVKMHLLNGPPP
jgi:hypothetical protein